MSDSDNDILDLIDQGAYSSAQQLIAKKLKKFPQRSYYYALQNQILLKLGKKEEALKGNISLLEKIPNDPQTLALLYDGFLELAQESYANQVYEQVIKRYPNNDKLILEWFDKSIDKFDLKLWNKIFVHLCKSSSNKLYKFWNAFTYLLLIEKEIPSEKEIGLFKILGLKLIESLAPFDNCQDLFVYISFLALNNQSDKVIDVIRSTGLNLDLDLMVKYRQILYDAKQWQLLYDFTKKTLFEDDLDDFNSWKLLIESGNQLQLSVGDLQEHFKFSSRNCTLAKVELALVYDKSDIEAQILNYYEKFNHKLCCVNDLKGYLKNIDSQTFANKIEESTSAILQSNPTSLNDLVRLINNQKFIYILRPQSDIFVTTNWKIYNIYKDNTEIRGGEFDNNPLNELMLISIILDLQKDQSTANVIKNIAIINKLLESDQYNHKLKLWLMKLYSSLNTGNLVSYHYGKLKIRMLQHESLGHHLTTINPSKDNLTVFVDIYRFYMTAHEEVNSGIMTGFNKGNFNKLAGFIDLGAKLSNSITRKFIILSIIKFSLILNDHGYMSYFVRNLIADSKLDETLLDNRDLTSEWKLGVFDKPQEILQHSFQEIDIKLWTLRYLIVFTSDIQYFKQYNKLISSYKLTHAFENLLNQIYLNIFKLFIYPNAKEVDAITNYLLKNLKFDKLKAVLIGDDVLSSQVNKNIVSWVEMIRTVNYLAKKHRQVKWTQLKATIDQSIQDLKKFNPVQQQVKKLSELKDQIKIDEVEVDVSNTVDLLTSSIEESWFKNI